MSELEVARPDLDRRAFWLLLAATLAAPAAWLASLGIVLGTAFANFDTLEATSDGVGDTVGAVLAADVLIALALWGGYVSTARSLLWPCWCSVVALVAAAPFVVILFSWFVG